jgi:hypothetical protein
MMEQWHYNVMVVDLTPPKPNASKIWEVRGPDGLTDWDRLQSMGRDGWELVDISPITAQYAIGNLAVTTQLLYTFKRKANANP